MEKLVNVNIKEDDSVIKLLNKKASRLSKKYNKQRKIDTKLLKPKSKLQKCLVIIFDVVCAVMVLFSSILCFVTINARISRTNPSFAGYSNFKIATGSMRKDTITINGVNYSSGHEVGENIIIRKVDTDTLNVGDKIVFYVYRPSYEKFDINSAIKDEEEKTTEFAKLSFASFFGIQTTEIREAAAAGARCVFHHIVQIYEDKSEERWFVTRGSSADENDNDRWYINESMVVGIYDSSSTGKVIAGIVSYVSSLRGCIVLLIPIVLMGAVIIYESIKEFQLVKLELDCVEEKRKITDDICVKNKIGLRMDNKTKYKILAQAAPDEINEYLSLLWKTGTQPVSIKKYYIRKQILIGYNKKLLLLNRKCEKRLKAGESATNVVKFYLKSKEKIEKEYYEKNERIKQLKKLFLNKKN